jgi:hypothetical protein
MKNLRVLVVAVLALGCVSQASAQVSPATEAPGRATRDLAHRAAFVAGGILLGAGLGFFTSHVVHNDWDKASNSTYVRSHRTYALGGSVAGAVLGLLAGRGSPSVAPTRSFGPAPMPHEGFASVISRDEIEATGAANAYDLVQRLRPTWLLEREAKRAAEQGRVVAIGGKGRITVAPGLPTIQVYLNQTSIGGLEALRQISTTSISSIERLSAAQANFRFGAGNMRGVIVVTTIGAASPMSGNP